MQSRFRCYFVRLVRQNEKRNDIKAKESPQPGSLYPWVAAAQYTMMSFDVDISICCLVQDKMH